MDAKVDWRLPYDHRGEQISVGEWLDRTETDAFLVLHNGKIIAEHYFGDMRPNTRHLLWSAGKSVFATIVWEHIQKGLLSLDATIEQYVPELGRTGFAGATIRQLLDQQTGIDYKEFPSDEQLAKMPKEKQQEWLPLFGEKMRAADHMFARQMRVSGFFRYLSGEKVIGIYDFLRTLKKNRAHGKYFYYAEPNVNALQWALERVTNRSYVDLLASFFTRMGLEHDPLISIDEVNTAVANGGLQMTAQDFARWAHILCTGVAPHTGEVFAGIKPLLRDSMSNPQSEKWTEETPDKPTCPPGEGYRNYMYMTPPIRNLPALPWAWGAMEQTAHVNPINNTVVIKLSSFYDMENYPKNLVAGHSFIQTTLPSLVGN